jgi:uncharacterized membrane protein YeiB
LVNPIPNTPPSISSAPKERVFGYDVARALAILGMVLVHFCLVMATEHLDAGWVYTFTEVLDGRAAALFVVLAGVGVTLRARKSIALGDIAAQAAVRRSLRRRGVFLLVAGFLNLIIWQGDILRVYGVILFLTPLFLHWSNRRLLGLSLAFVGGFIALMLLMDYSKNWDWDAMEYHHLWTPSGLLRNLFYDGFRAVFPWAGLFCAGMWLGRLDLAQPAMRRRLVWGSAGLLVGALILSRAVVHYVTVVSPQMNEEEAEFLFGTTSMPPLPLFLLTALGAAGLTIAVCLWVAENYPRNLIVRALVATGRMALTWYIFHIVFGLGAVILFGLHTTQPPALAVAAGCTFFLLAMGLSHWWMKRHQQGPLEALLRRVAG